MVTVKKKSAAGKKRAGGSSVKSSGKRPKAATRRDKVISKASVSSKPRKGKKDSAASKSVVRKAATRRPVKKKEAAKPDKARELRRSLLQKRETIIKEAKEEIAKYISGENRQLVDTALDEGDLAVVDISEDVNLMRLASHRQSLLDIDETLLKLDEGTYGICEECGEEISEKRLSVLPTANLCRDCQENKERLEAIEKGQLGL